ncbi:hypothetical protein [Sphingopyxis sp. JAI128]|uniref:hypothetical protein n=1 Tax=Sphingopyxis sp. JAI128 TaxID=2723066 RepID=UPI001613A437|nr:hypothetical protein [Sphingopyxis sp. JAI128]MBB6424935.1 hypothetical protein [Sphingopyxis sp. JAI128]
MGQTSTTTCSHLGNSINCRTVQQPVYSPPPPIQQVEVMAALRNMPRPAPRELVAPPARHFGEDAGAEFIRFREANEWYDLGGLAGATETQKRARAMADRTADRMAGEGLQRKIAPSEFFARVANEVRAKFPDLQ